MNENKTDEVAEFITRNKDILKPITWIIISAMLYYYIQAYPLSAFIMFISLIDLYVAIYNRRNDRT